MVTEWIVRLKEVAKPSLSLWKFLESLVGFSNQFIVVKRRKRVVLGC